MSNNSKEAPQRKEQSLFKPLSKRTRMLITLANWVGNFNMVDSNACQRELLSSLKETYLLSNDANDRDERDMMLNLFNHLEELLRIMNTFGVDDYRQLDEWLLEMNGLIDKELANELS